MSGNIEVLSNKILYSRVFIYVLDFFSDEEILSKLQFLSHDVYNVFVPEYCQVSGRPGLWSFEIATPNPTTAVKI